jgi:hypothetical protein
MRNVQVSAGCLLFGTIALDAGNEAPSLSIANVNVADAAGVQEPLDASLDLMRRWTFADDDPSALAISFQGQGKGTQLLGKHMSFSKSRARPGMNEDWTRGRIFVETGKWVVSEQNAVFFPGAELLQTRAAWTVTGCKFHMGRMPILRRLQRATDLFGKCRIDG